MIKVMCPVLFLGKEYLSPEKRFLVSIENLNLKKKIITLHDMSNTKKQLGRLFSKS